MAGTPTDCVHLALTGLLEFEPDIVVSGINNAANLGDDVIYSGTVSAAMEGRFLGLPAVAVSLVSRNHDRSTSRDRRACCGGCRPAQADPLPADTILNACRTCRGARSGLRGHPPRQPPSCRRLHRAEGSARQRGVLDHGPAGREQDSGPGTDFHAVRTGHISITPIRVDLTRYQALEKVASWVGGLSAALDQPA